MTWSDALYAIFGVERGAFAPGMDSVLTFCHADDRAHVSQIISEAAGAGTEFEVDYRITRPDGQARTIISKGKPELDDSGQVVAMFGVSTDVTEAFDTIRSIQD